MMQSDDGVKVYFMSTQPMVRWRVHFRRLIAGRWQTVAPERATRVVFVNEARHCVPYDLRPNDPRDISQATLDRLVRRALRASAARNTGRIKPFGDARRWG